MYKIGIVGLGAIARNMHIPVLSNFKDVNIDVVADIDKGGVEKVVKRFKIRKAYQNYEEMFEESQLDAVFISVPPIAHYVVAKSALEHGLHVFCEKPMGISSSQAMELVRASQKRNLVLQVGYNLRGVKNYVRAAKIIEGMRLGRILQVHATMTRPGPYVGWMPNGEWHLEKEGGGVLYDLGSHLLDLINYILSEKIVDISAKSIETMHLNIVDNIAGAFETESGAIGTVNIGWRAGINFDSIEIHGTAGYAFVNPLEFEEVYGSFDMLGKALYHARAAKHVLTEGIHLLISKNVLDTYTEQDRSFIDSINAHVCKRPYASGEDAAHTLMVIEAFKNSLKTGKSSIVESLKKSESSSTFDQSRIAR